MCDDNELEKRKTMQIQSVASYYSLIISSNESYLHIKHYTTVIDRLRVFVLAWKVLAKRVSSNGRSLN